MDVFPVPGKVDPSQYVLPWDTVFESLTLIILIAFVLERVLALLFESPLFLKYVQRLDNENKHPPKTLIASALSVSIALIYKIDILAILTGLPEPSAIGCVVTGLLVAGGSKASIKLFRDFLDIKSNAYRDAKASTKQPKTDAKV